MNLLQLLIFVVICSFTAASSSTLYARISFINHQSYIGTIDSQTDFVATLDPKTGLYKIVMQLDTYQGVVTPFFGGSAVDPDGVFYYTSGLQSGLISRANITSKTYLYSGMTAGSPYLSYSLDNNLRRLLVPGMVYGGQEIIIGLYSWPALPNSYPQLISKLSANLDYFVGTSGTVDAKNQIYYWIENPSPKTIQLRWTSITNLNQQVFTVQLQCNNQLNPLSMTFDSARQKLMLYGGLYDTAKQLFTLYINTVDSTGKCNAVMTTLTYTQYVSTFGYDEVNQVVYVSVDSTLYTLNARTGAIINTVTIANGLVPYSLNVVYN